MKVLPKATLLATALLVATLGATAVPAAADTPLGYCTASASPVIDGVVADTGGLDYACFASPAEAIAHGTGGGFTPSAGADETTVLAELDAFVKRLAAIKVPAEANTLVGIQWDDDIFQARRSLYWFVSNTKGCSNGAAYAVNSMPSSWNDEVDEAEGRSGCSAFVHWEHNNRSGSSVSCSCSDLGALEDETSSLHWWNRDGTPSNPSADVFSSN